MMFYGYVFSPTATDYSVVFEDASAGRRVPRRSLVSASLRLLVLLLLSSLSCSVEGVASYPPPPTKPKVHYGGFTPISSSSSGSSSSGSADAQPRWKTVGLARSGGRGRPLAKPLMLRGGRGRPLAKPLMLRGGRGRPLAKPLRAVGEQLKEKMRNYLRKKYEKYYAANPQQRPQNYEMILPDDNDIWVEEESSNDIWVEDAMRSWTELLNEYGPPPATVTNLISPKKYRMRKLPNKGHFKGTLTSYQKSRKGRYNVPRVNAGVLPIASLNNRHILKPHFPPYEPAY
ncbi:unnamed protein product [Cyprideis torosa]|uniref:Uncharacterized protein n=1 Tax=Cyprideis torosa TaxID=163714 RepID=A0A7R8W4R1_9CRUS|nr:unnamed protein product [Cyprideis torosa]CAG0884461.1 unnamed protein product [Cyprideis torosa]